MKKLAILLSCIMLLSCVVFQPAYAKTTAPTDGLVIYYNFDENVNDQKGNNSFDAVDSSRYVDGVLGKALSFTGVQNDVLYTGWKEDLTKITETGSFTFSTWYKATNGTPVDDSQHAFFGRGSYAGNTGNWLFIQGVSGNIGASCSMGGYYSCGRSMTAKISVAEIW